MDIEKRQSILRQVNVTQDRFDQIGLNWDELIAIFKDYTKKYPELLKTAEVMANSLMAVTNVHSVRFRAKDPEHLIAKIIRKRNNDPNRDISMKNYQSEITDLIGVRAIHLLKNHWKPIDKFIIDKWDLHEQQIAYIRAGDPKSYSKSFGESGFKIEEHQFGYRSLHYIAITKPGKEQYLAEIQVRTIFEEGWSEIDHKVRYPNATDNPLFNEFLSIFNRLAGSADEMGSFIMNLKSDLFEQKIEFKDKLREKDKVIKELTQKIEGLEIEPTAKADIVKSLGTIKDFTGMHVEGTITDLLQGFKDGLAGRPNEQYGLKSYARPLRERIRRDNQDKPKD